MKAENAFDYHIRKMWLLISRIYNKEAAKHQSTMAWGYVLLNIDLEHGTPATHLGPKMGIKKHSLVRVLNSLEKEGLIEKVPSFEDKRIMLVRLTEEGLIKRELAKQKVMKLNDHLYQNISKTKRKFFFEVMEEINELLQDEDIF